MDLSSTIRHIINKLEKCFKRAHSFICLFYWIYLFILVIKSNKTFAFISEMNKSFLPYASLFLSCRQTDCVLTFVALSPLGFREKNIIGDFFFPPTKLIFAVFSWSSRNFLLFDSQESIFPIHFLVQVFSVHNIDVCTCQTHLRFGAGRNGSAHSSQPPIPWNVFVTLAIKPTLWEIVLDCFCNLSLGFPHFKTTF